MPKIFAKMSGNPNGKIFAKIHHNYNFYTAIEIFCDRIFCDFEHSQIFAKNSVANKFESTVLISLRQRAADTIITVSPPGIALMPLFYLVPDQRWPDHCPYSLPDLYMGSCHLLLHYQSLLSLLLDGWPSNLAFRPLIQDHAACWFAS